MVIKIQTQQTGIPVEIGELTFTFDTSDESIKNLREAGNIFTKEIEKIKEDDEDAVLEITKKGYDLLLGEGAFEKLYKETPSLIQLIKIFYQLTESINQELSSIGKVVTQQDKAQQYIKAKKNKANK